MPSHTTVCLRAILRRACNTQLNDFILKLREQIQLHNIHSLWQLHPKLHTTIINSVPNGDCGDEMIITDNLMILR